MRYGRQKLRWTGRISIYVFQGTIFYSPENVVAHFSSFTFSLPSKEILLASLYSMAVQVTYKLHHFEYTAPRFAQGRTSPRKR